MSEFDHESVSLLIHRARDGCQKSKSELICQLQSYMHLMAGQFSDRQHNHRLGQSDIVQQSVMIVIKEFDGFRGSTRGEFKAWLKQILINEIRKNARDLGRQKRDISRERSIDAAPHGFHARLTGDEVEPDRQAIEQEQLMMMRRAIQQLSDDRATVIQLRSLERLPFKEVAAQMGRSIDAVTKLWYRAVLDLQQRMNQDR